VIRILLDNIQPRHIDRLKVDGLILLREAATGGNQTIVQILQDNGFETRPINFMYHHRGALHGYFQSHKHPVYITAEGGHVVIMTMLRESEVKRLGSAAEMWTEVRRDIHGHNSLGSMRKLTLSFVDGQVSSTEAEGRR
jgi:hypothetical protein